MRCPFDPSKSWHKSISGAVAAGNSLWLRVVLPRDFGVSACRLIISEDGKKDSVISMTWDNTDGIEEWWQTEIYLDAPKLLFYRFQYENSWGKTDIGAGKETHLGEISSKEKWQLTVYSPDYHTPDWIKGGIIYQIFPDRFCFSGKKKENIPTDRIIRNDWGGTPVYLPDENGIIRNNDYFCGDFKGIEEKLSYIASLGVNCIYLNPICEAHSNHRYDTADYKKCDPLLGTIEDFSSLCEKAAEYGIKIIIDGVYSHTGADSIYFNKYNRYERTGAYNSADSPYRSWYKFGKSNDKYESWWGIDTLPETKEEDSSFSQFITGENGVIDFWLKAGAAGIRLDVADELPDGFLDKVHDAVKRNGEDKYLLGEVWEDATNKISHGGRRRFLLGSQLDSVMNYPFRKAVIDFLLNSNAERFMHSVFSITENYPPEALHSAMNHLGTHDTERILTLLSGVSCEGKSREMQADISISDEALKRGIKLLKMALVINFTLPGIPSIYYGDEAGLTGCKDPFNRFCFPWGAENTDILNFTKNIALLRKEYEVLKDGGFYPISAALGCVAYLRYKEGAKRIFVVINKNPQPITYWLNPDMTDMIPVFGGVRFGGGVIVPGDGFAVLSDN
ncbi:MAG: glycoside hydrolase family 13 protein [Clostridia bacterium]|nr:glycoside hydrolase family 13 protein [Clostridia bacterium]